MRMLSLFLAAFMLSNGAGRTVLTGEFSLDDHCDPMDRDLHGTNQVLWAYNEHDPMQSDASDMRMHSHKGHSKIVFEEIVQEPDTDEVIKELFVKPQKHKVPCCERKSSAPGTYYNSMGFDLWEIFPEANATNAVHVTAWGGAIGTDKMGTNNVNNVHHVNMQVCEHLDEGLNPENWGESHILGDVSQDLYDCWLDKGNNPIVVFVIGMEPQVFPPEAGLLVGGPEGYRYVMMEIHYDIPWYEPEGSYYRNMHEEEWVLPANWTEPSTHMYEHRSDGDNYLYDDSGIQFWYTPNLRKHNIGPVWIGINPIRDESIIPPGQPNFYTYSVHNPNCFRPFFPGEGKVKIAQILLHGHDFAKELRVRHIRNGVELPLMVEDNDYDNWYQQWFETDIDWRVDDDIILECVIDSTTEQHNILHGLATNEEQCIVFFMIYPWFGPWSPIEWTSDLRVLEDKPEMFRSASGDPCIGEEYKFPSYEPLMTEDPCEVQHTGGEGYMTQMAEKPRYWDEEIDGHFNENDYKSHHILDEVEKKCKLHYTYYRETKKVDFAYECDTNGWIGIGFSPTGGMKGSDMFFGWVDDNSGEVFFYDAFGVGNERPKIDTYNRLKNVRGWQDGVYPKDPPKTPSADPTQPQPQCPKPKECPVMICPDTEKCPEPSECPVVKAGIVSEPAEIDSTPPTANTGALVVLVGIFGVSLGIILSCIYTKFLKKKNNYIDTPGTEMRADDFISAT